MHLWRGWGQVSNVTTEKIAGNFGAPLRLHSVLILSGLSCLTYSPCGESTVVVIGRLLQFWSNRSVAA